MDFKREKKNSPKQHLIGQLETHGSPYRET